MLPLAAYFYHTMVIYLPWLEASVDSSSLLIVYEDDEKSELLNTYFIFISSLEDANVAFLNSELKTTNFLRDLINKPSGPDIIGHKMLKLCTEKIAAPLQIMFNKSLLQCKYPTSWKIAHGIAI